MLDLIHVCIHGVVDPLDTMFRSLEFTAIHGGLTALHGGNAGNPFSSQFDALCASPWPRATARSRRFTVTPGLGPLVQILNSSRKGAFDPFGRSCSEFSKVAVSSIHNST